MLIIPVKDGENIDIALKHQGKFDRTGPSSIASKTAITKPSVKRRAQILKAQYIQI